jgi:hypothetical protein
VTLAKTGAANDKTTQTRERVILITLPSAFVWACEIEYRQARGVVSHRMELNPGGGYFGKVVRAHSKRVTTLLSIALFLYRDATGRLFDHMNGFAFFLKSHINQSGSPGQ